MTFTASLCNITCRCGHTAPFEQFTERPVTGTMPQGSYQCPSCHYAWKTVKGRRRWSTDFYPPLKIKPITARL